MQQRYICGMVTILAPDMRVKLWTPAQVRELVDLAKEKKVSARKLAEYVGVSVTSLNNWATGREGRAPSEGMRRALTLAELCVVLEIEPEVEGEGRTRIDSE